MVPLAAEPARVSWTELRACQPWWIFNERRGGGGENTATTDAKLVGVGKLGGTQPSLKKGTE